MGVIATWGAKTFEVNSERIVPITGLTTSYKLKSDANSDTSGTGTTNTRGVELETVAFSTKYMAVAGVNVRAEFGSWRKLIGSSYPLIIGGVRFGPEKFMLENASISETQIDVNGTFLEAVVALSFKEDSGSKTSKSKTGVKSSSGGKGASSSKTGIQERIEQQKTIALNTRPTVEDKRTYAVIRR